jgi:hypothetical protein
MGCPFEIILIGEIGGFILLPICFADYIRLFEWGVFQLAVSELVLLGYSGDGTPSGYSLTW